MPNGAIREAHGKRIFTGDGVVEWAMRHRWMFIDEEAVEKLGLREHAKEQQDESSNKPG